MHIDARNLSNNTIIEGDICIIGAGAAGISIAMEWINTQYKVILLESGGFEYDTKLQELNDGSSSGQKYFPLQSTRLRYFGGTTGHWTGLCSPLDPLDFMKRDHVPNSGWPITKEDLDPFYERAQKTLQLGPYQYDLAYWKNQRPNMIAYPLDEKVIRTKIWQINAARFGNLYRESIINAPNVHLYTYASAVDISANEAVSHIEEVVVKNKEGKTHKVRAKYFVMACGAIQNARLLLSFKKQAPKGLGNDNDVVGRYFMEHLDIKAGELWLFDTFETDLYSWGPTKAEMAITETQQLKSKTLNATVSVHSPLAVGKHVQPLIETWQDADPRKASEQTEDRSFISKLVRLKSKILKPTAFDMDCNSEQAPNPNSRITLSNELDYLGVQKPHLHWELLPLSKQSIRRTLELIGRQMGAAGFGRVKLKEFLQDENDPAFPESVSGAFHHMGTTRMHNDPKQGVVDSNCKIHGLSNLYVAGSGCFPTSGAVNPTLTLVALSIRLSDHLKRSVEAI